MDEVARGMTKAGQQAEGKPVNLPDEKKGLADKLKGLAKDAAAKVGKGMKSAGQKISDAAK
jgi:hypothetical protein